MHRIRQLILAGTKPPDCFEPASKEIRDEMYLAGALVFSLRVSDWRSFEHIRHTFALKPAGQQEWGPNFAPGLHKLRAFYHEVQDEMLVGIEDLP